MYKNKNGFLIPVDIKNISPAELLLLSSENDEDHILFCRKENIVYVKNVSDLLTKRIKVNIESLEEKIETKEKISISLNYIGVCFLLSRLSRYIKDDENLSCIECALNDFVKSFPGRFVLLKNQKELILNKIDTRGTD